MKLIWLFLHIVALSAFTVSPTKASSDSKSSVDFQAMHPSIVRVAQQIAVDTGKPLIDKSSGQAKPSELEKSLPAIVPEAKVADAKKTGQLSPAFQQLCNQP